MGSTCQSTVWHLTLTSFLWSISQQLLYLDKPYLVRYQLVLCMSFDRYLDLNITVKSTFCFVLVHICQSAIPIFRQDISVSTLVIYCSSFNSFGTQSVSLLSKSWLFSASLLIYRLLSDFHYSIIFFMTSSLLDLSYPTHMM